MTTSGGPGTPRLLSPVTLSLDVHRDDVSELSVTVAQHRETDKHTGSGKHTERH